MRFEFTSSESRSVLRAVLEEGDQTEGLRQEGSGATIVFSGEDIEFDYGVTAIHPDLLGLLCLIIFYPFVGERVVFPMPVSPRLEEAFRNPNFRRQFSFDNVDSSVEMYSGSHMALAFGGGIDSSAIRTMFPEAYVVHEAHWRHERLVPSGTHGVVHDLGLDRGRVVTTNQRYVSEPGGWHGWTCSLATTLLMATDHDFGIILMGATLGGTLLRGGIEYWDRFRARDWHGVTGNFWQSAFNAVGMPVFSPVCGASAFLTMRLSLDPIRAGEVFYCTERDGSACRQCPKCLRRDIVRAVVDPGHRPQWAPYDNEDARAYLERDPLDHGHVFSFARRRVDGLPRFIGSRLKDLQTIETDWPLRVHAGTFDFCDDRWRPTMRERVLEHLDPMRPEHIAELETWNGARPARSSGAGRLASMLRRIPSQRATTG